jgi:hypothetical protein
MAELQEAIDARPVYDPRRVLESDYFKMFRAYVTRVNKAARQIGVEPLHLSEARDYQLLVKWQLDGLSAESLAGIPGLRAERTRLKRARDGARSESDRKDLGDRLDKIEDMIADAKHEARRLRNRMPALADELGLPPRKSPRRGRPRKSGR